MASANDILRVVAEFAWLGQTVMNVYDLFVGDDALDADLADDITLRLDQAYAELEDSLVTGLAGTGIKITNVTQAEDIGEFPFPNFTTGANVGDTLPPGVALLVTFPTNRLKSRGRKFLPGLSEVQVSAGVFSGSVLTQAAAYAALVASPWIGTNSGSPLSFGVQTALGGFRTFTGGVVSTVPAYQRRRKQGVGV